MHARHMERFSIFLALLWVGTSGACSSSDDGPTPEEQERAAIAEALEADNGGFTTDDEADMFGEKGTFSKYGLDEAAAAVEDAIGSQPDVEQAAADREHLLYSIVLAWGQLKVNPSVKTPTTWDGTISVSRGALMVRRTIQFEDGDEVVFPRENRKTVSFHSSTTRHFDGLMLQWILAANLDPDVAGVPTITFDAGGVSKTLSMDELTRTVQVVPANDEQQNRVAIVGFERDGELCEEGFLQGRWITAADTTSLGKFYGQWVDADGEIAGYLKGIWGKRRDGAKVLFGKYVPAGGGFGGVLVGTYGNGEYKARILDKSQAVLGWLRGAYVMATGPERTGGYMAGEWSIHCPDDVEGVRDVMSRIGEALGVDTEDPYFGDAAFEALGQVAEDPTYDDPILQSDPEVAAAMGGDGFALVLDVAWGYFERHPLAQPKEWGTEGDPLQISVNRGALVVIRTRVFEDADQVLTPRADRRTVTVASSTRPSWDGLKLVWLLDRSLDDRGDRANPAVTFTSRGFSQTVEMRARTSGEPPMPLQAFDVDELGHQLRIHGVTLRPLPSGCEAGFMGGRWIPAPTGANKPIVGGVYYGRWIGLTGELKGYVKGVWGVDPTGAPRLLGKVIDKDGGFVGNLFGEYRDDYRFMAVWRTADDGGATPPPWGSGDDGLPGDRDLGVPDRDGGVSGRDLGTPDRDVGARDRDLGVPDRDVGLPDRDTGLPDEPGIPGIGKIGDVELGDQDSGGVGGRYWVPDPTDPRGGSFKGTWFTKECVTW